MKTMLKKTLTMLAFALGITTFASAAEIYHNQLAGGVVVPAGTYGGITVATDILGAFPSTSVVAIPATSGQTSGSYANVIKKVSGNTDTQTHTVSGWFRVTKKASDDTILWAALSSTSSSHGGYKVAVTKNGYLKVGKCKYSLADNGVLTSSTAVPNSQWFYLTVVITKSSSARTATVQAFVNGESFTMPTGTFDTNLDGEKCISFQVGDSVSYAGLRIDDTAVTDTATIKSWATNATYCVPVSDASTWTGAAGDGDPANEENWQDSKVPTEATVSYVSGTSLPIKPFACRAMVLTADVSLSANCDWALTSMISCNGHKIDLKGKELKTSSPWIINATITDSTKDAANPGKLFVSVANSVTLENTLVVLGGNLQFVKDGTGTFISRLTNQNYTGGTVVDAGTIKSIGYENNYYYGKDATPFTINADGTLDINGQYSWYRHHIYLNGGTLANYKGSQTTTGNRSLGDITLTADSTMRFGYHVIFNDTDTRYLDLGGHTLEVKYANDVGGDGKAILYALSTNWKNGTVVLGSNIVLRPYSASTFADDLTLVVNGDLQMNQVDKTFGNLTDNSEGTHEAYGKTLTVNGAYKPLSPYLHSVKMANGSTLDLNEQEDAWSFTCKSGKNQTLTYVDDATITIDVSKRDLAIGT